MNKIKEAEKLRNIVYIDGVYKNIRSKLTWKCNVCGKEFEKDTCSIIHKGSGCPYCLKFKKDKKNDELKKNFDIKRIAELSDKFKEENVELISYYRNKNNVLYLVLFNHNLDRYGNEYGEYKQEYNAFKNGAKYSKIAKDNIAITTEEWIKIAKEKHPEYDFSKVMYKNKNKAVTITCPKHGDFTIYPKVFLKDGCKCPVCRIELLKENKKKKGLEKLENYLKESGIKVKEGTYVSNDRAATLILPNGKEIRRVPKFVYNKNPEEHIKLENKRDIRIEKIKNKKDKSEVKKEILMKRQENFNEKMKELHPTLDFSQAVYLKTHDKVSVICHEKDEFGDEHGIFYITPHNLLAGYGCKKCSKCYMDRELFIKRANLVHHDKYDYSKVEYKNNHTKICITCPKHGDFWQMPYSHLDGKGCPECGNSHFEVDLAYFFKTKNLNYIYHYRRKEIFGQQSLDFYFPDINVGIECQGEQHFIANFFKSRGIEYAEKHLKYVQSLDKRKKRICRENGIRLIYFLDNMFVKYLDSDDEYFTNKEDLLKFIEDENNKIKHN